jgi:hypothetical protein
MVVVLLLLGCAKLRAEPDFRRIVHLTLVGSEPAYDELKIVLLEWNPALVITQVSQLEANQVLLEASNGESLKIWVTTRASGVVLYFEDPTVHRFLVRHVNLESGLDESGREILLQVIDTSVQALVENQEASTRDELVASFDATLETLPSRVVTDQPTVAPHPIAPVSKVLLSGHVRTQRNSKTQSPTDDWETRIGAFYGLQWFGAKQPAHGPGLVLGTNRRWGSWQAVAAMRPQYQFGVQFPDELGKLSLQSVEASLALGIEHRWNGNTRWGVEVAPGMARIKYSFAPAVDSNTLSRSPSSHMGLFTYFGWRIGWQYEAIYFGAVLGAKVSFLRSHYDISGGTTRAPWLVTPSVMVELLQN